MNRKKVLFIMTHDFHLEGNIGYVYNELVKKDYPLKYYWICKNDLGMGVAPRKLLKTISLFLVKSYHMATANYIFLDNVFLPMAYMKFNAKVKVIQLWHGSGAVKKFGQDCNTGRLARLEYSANQSYTHVIVSSIRVVDQHVTAFGVNRENVYPIGVPRVDFFYESSTQSESLNEFYTNYPELKNKKKILYAPTFRDDEINTPPSIEMNFEKLIESLDESYIILLRLHPHIRKHSYKHNYSNRLYDVSEYYNLNGLLLASDILVTDYSSIIFDYMYLERPMIFYAYDLKSFKDNSRGFYFDYETFVPGPVVKNTDQLINEILNETFNLDMVREFKNTYINENGAHATKRLINLVFSKL
ncbi:CDP-glycerol glycerophosphotransferase family protein [Paenibacillus sp. J5C2022]|uniref:CDP-glycerol glycerophosphotransferase family protein n=1 Tax=Paenibacillus sp. J5C2022 TaxID=2977129 RepID=UPI0021D28130|nr:CDP-glycerol glycerophosphotransferase family protein [Paenibacillus sp. J5C2022]